MRAERLSRGMTATVTAAPLSLASPHAVRGSLSDVELVAAVRRGDDRAFERLYERYHRRIASYIYGMVSDYGRAEDIAQDVFMSALRRMRETDRPIAFKPWVYEIAKNACIDQFRRSRRTEEISFDAEEGLGADDHGRLMMTGPTPDAAVDQKMTLDHLCGAFGGLSDTHHQILVMRELEGLSYRDIGERLGMSRPSVESTLFRARRRLTEEYEELISGRRCLRVQAIIVGAVEVSPGARDQRRVAAHISHCQTCRRAAHRAGVDIAPNLGKVSRAKIAAWLPMPLFMRRRIDDGADICAASTTHASTLAQVSAQVGATMDPAFVGWAKAAVAAATMAIVGIGAGEGTERIANQTERARPAIAKQHATPSARATAPSRVAVKSTPVAVGTATIAAPTAREATSAAGPSPVAASGAAPITAMAASSAGVPAVPAVHAPTVVPAGAPTPSVEPLLDRLGEGAVAGEVPVLVDPVLVDPLAEATGAVQSVVGIVGGR
ncbi:MAG: sigma-70 family polymerase sigma factor [Solirubrobacterales bacterium]|nr:sigma-70 family polymerase sigma factor [Solirubrobacterales bacterium]